MKGQLSAEMLIVLVIVLGLAILLASTMMNSAEKAGQKVDEKTGKILNYCSSDLDCSSGQTCNTNTHQCS